MGGDRVNIKAIEAIPGWYSIAKKAGELYGTIDAYEKVPMLYRAVNLRSDALGTVPYKIMRNGAETDYPFVTALEPLIQQTERSLLLTGHAIWLKLYKGRILYGFQFLNPQTITVEFVPEKASALNPLSGLVFTQQINSITYGPWTMDDVIYFREPSLSQDIGRGTPAAGVALQSAQLAYYLERFTSAFFEHGAQPALVMSLDKSVTPPEFERMRSDWRARAENVANAFRTFWMRGEIKTQIITFPLKDMELIQLQERAVTNITTTFGVPRTMLEASAANYATADSDRQSFWRETIVPRLSYYERILNEQIFGPLEYSLEYHPDELDVFQTDEAARAGSLLQLTQAGVPLASAMNLLGYKNVEEALGMATPEELPDTTGINEETGEAVTDPDLADMQDTAEKRIRDLELYHKKALHRLREGKSPAVKFTSDHLPRYMTDFLEMELRKAKKKIAVDEIFYWMKSLTVADLTPDEKKIYRAIADKLQTRTDQNAERILAGDYTGIDTDLRGVMTENVADLILKAGSNKVSPITGIDDAQSRALVESGIQDYRNTYIDSYYNPFLQDLQSTEKEYIDQVIQSSLTTVGVTVDDIRSQLSAFGDLRAQRIAFTEPTRAAAQMTNTIQSNSASAGIPLERVWFTEGDGDNVCDECIKLNNKPETEWGPEYMDGPPAHVNCRCAIGLQLAQSAITDPVETAPEILDVDTAQELSTPPPAETPPALYEQTPAEMADAVRSMISDELNDAVIKLNQIRDEMKPLELEYQRIEKEMKKASKARELSLFIKLSADRKPVALALNEKIRAAKSVSALIENAETPIYRDILNQLQHENPQQVSVTFSSKFPADVRLQMEEFIKLTYGTVESNGSILSLPVQSLRGLERAYHYRGAIHLSDTTTVSTTIHETLHAMQYSLGTGQTESAQFAAERTAGESLEKLSKLIPASKYDADEKAYRDAVDSPYTLKLYAGNTIQNRSSYEFLEILPMALSNISEVRQHTDRGLLELGMSVLKGGRSK
jgi:HK97 family phage portal protein